MYCAITTVQDGREASYFKSSFLFLGSAKISLNARLTPGSSKYTIKVIPFSCSKVYKGTDSLGGELGGVLTFVPPDVQDYNLHVSLFTISSD